MALVNGGFLHYTDMKTFLTIFFSEINGQIFSSPEHEVLMVSYCDRAVSGVRRPSCVVRHPSSTFNLVYALEATVLVGYS